jgi:glycosyltransferase involved in cell wall biosynthesis
MRVAIIWHGLPAYAARLIRSVTREDGLDLQIFGTHSPESPDYLEHVMGMAINWISPCTADKLATDLNVDVCFVSGWAFSECNTMARAARIQGADVVAMIDNRWRGDLRQQLGRLYFSLRQKKSIDFAWVPGASGQRFCRSLGFSEDRIAQGLYGGDPEIFFPVVGRHRPPRIGFVGQLIHRKGFDLLVPAFKSLKKEFPECELHVFGQGNLAFLAAQVPGLTLHPFAKPDTIAVAMQDFRIFVMPSRDDNWPLALHEAALSGCALVTTRNVGNAIELVRADNGVVVAPGNLDSLADGLRSVTAWSVEQFETAERVSRRLAADFGPARWRQEFLKICSFFRESRRSRGRTRTQ